MKKLLLSSLSTIAMVSCGYSSIISEVEFTNIVPVSSKATQKECLGRYNGTHEMSSKENSSETAIYSSSGDKIELTERNNKYHQGVFIVNESYEISIPKVKKKLTGYMYGTKVSKGMPLEGVFTDGECKGNIKINYK